MFTFISIVSSLLTAVLSLVCARLTYLSRVRTKAALDEWQRMYRVEHEENIHMRERLSAARRAQRPQESSADQHHFSIEVRHGHPEPWRLPPGPAGAQLYDDALQSAGQLVLEGWHVRICAISRPGLAVVELTPMHPLTARPTQPQWSLLMAVSPGECLELNQRQQALRADREARIDRWLRDKYEGQPIEIIIPQNIKGRVLRVLLLHYQQAGWNIREQMRNGSRHWQFSQKPDTTPVLEENRTRTIDLTPHALPPENTNAPAA